jgi:hypothetical protein
MKHFMIYQFIAIFILLTSAQGCSGQFWGGSAAGAVASGGGYEYNMDRQMKKVEEDYKAGRINESEYNIRKNQIQRDSLIK